MPDLIKFILYVIGFAVVFIAPFAYIDNELRIEAIFGRFKRVLQQGIVDILNWFESFNTHNKNK